MTTNQLWRIKYPERAKAHYIVQNAMRRGDIIKHCCEICGNIKTHAHHDNYNKPLDIRWLCSTCHSQYHKYLRDKDKPPKIKVDRKEYKRNRKSREIIPNPFTQDVITLRELGKTYREISKIVGLSSSQCYKIINNTTYN